MKNLDFPNFYLRCPLTVCSKYFRTIRRSSPRKMAWAILATAYVRGFGFEVSRCTRGEHGGSSSTSAIAAALPSRLARKEGGRLPLIIFQNACTCAHFARLEVNRVGWLSDLTICSWSQHGLATRDGDSPRLGANVRVQTFRPSFMNRRPSLTRLLAAVRFIFSAPSQQCRVPCQRSARSLCCLRMTSLLC